ncbi:hypothetical protein [Streptomyces sp. SPB78]|uniref:hypothetical protein n=1 Tax=Streptomyces sp. (strain SPB78) TaxID=591157 RepID=UPI0001B53EBF|nr:hypothetical protein [Streptomyces sp. SPB78]
MSDRRLQLPEHSRANGPEPRCEAGMPEDVQFATKPSLVREMIETALGARFIVPG